jgi:hypothetical protein
MEQGDRFNQFSDHKSALDLASLAYKLDNKKNLGILKESSQKSQYLAKSKSQSKLGKNSETSLDEEMSEFHKEE